MENLLKAKQGKSNKIQKNHKTSKESNLDEKLIYKETRWENDEHIQFIERNTCIKRYRH